MKKNKEFIKKFTVEYYKFLVMLGGMFLTVLFSSMAGYGFLHYVQGLTMMSSPITLMQSFAFGSLTAFFIALMFNETYNKELKRLNKGGI